MKKSTAGLLAGAGAILAWFFRHKIRRKFIAGPFVRSITLTMKKGGCGIEQEPQPVTLSKRRDDTLRWDISSPMTTGCEGQRTVCIGNWRLHGTPTSVPPVSNPTGLCRQVRKGGPPQPILAHINHDAAEGDYEYDILVDNVVVHDPIVKLTL